MTKNLVTEKYLNLLIDLHEQFSTYNTCNLSVVIKKHKISSLCRMALVHLGIINSDKWIDRQPDAEMAKMVYEYVKELVTAYRDKKRQKSESSNGINIPSDKIDKYLLELNTIYTASLSGVRFSTKNEFSDKYKITTRMFNTMRDLNIISELGAWMSGVPTRSMATKILIKLTQDNMKLTAITNKQLPELQIGSPIEKRKKQKYPKVLVKKYLLFLEELRELSKNGKVDNDKVRSKYGMSSVVFQALGKMNIFSRCAWISNETPNLVMAKHVIKKLRKMQNAYYHSGKDGVVKKKVKVKNKENNKKATSDKNTKVLSSISKSLPIIDTNRMEQKETVKPIEKHAFGIYGNVFLTKEEFNEKLIDSHGKMVTDKAIDLLSEYKFAWIKSGKKWEDLNLYGDYSSIKFFDYIRKAAVLINENTVENSPFEDSTLDNLESYKKGEKVEVEKNPEDRKGKREFSLIWGLVKVKF